MKNQHLSISFVIYGPSPVALEDEFSLDSITTDLEELFDGYATVNPLTVEGGENLNLNAMVRDYGLEEVRKLAGEFYHLVVDLSEDAHVNFTFSNGLAGVDTDCEVFQALKAGLKDAAEAVSGSLTIAVRIEV